MPIYVHSNVRPLKITLIIGLVIFIIFSTNIISLVNSVLVSSNFFFSKVSLLNARITLRPVRFSRVNSVILSTIFWNILNFGITNTMIMVIVVAIAAAPTAIIQLISGAVWIAIINEITHDIGAISISDSIIIIVCCIWFTSLVVRLISDAVLKSFRSSLFRPSTLLKISALKSRA